MTWLISDAARLHLLTRDALWRPIHGTDLDDEALIAFPTEAEALAFCLGYRASGGVALPFRGPS